MKILISACLLGLPCRYDGASKPQLWVEELARRHELIPMCPEQMGGLPHPAKSVGTAGRPGSSDAHRGGRDGAVPPGGGVCLAAISAAGL